MSYRNFLSNGLLAATVLTFTSCGSTHDTAVVSGNDAGVVLSGRVLDGPVEGAVVKAYHLQPGGIVGEGGDAVLSFPVPPPTEVAVSAATDRAGRFTLRLPDRRPVLLVAGGGRYTDPITDQVVELGAGEAFEAVVATPDDRTFAITPLSTLAARLALAKARGGESVDSAVNQANGDLAAFFKLSELFAPGSDSDQQDLAALLIGLHQLAADQGLSFASLVDGLGRDLTDGRFDGGENGKPLEVRTSGGATTRLTGTFGKDLVSSLGHAPGVVLAQTSGTVQASSELTSALSSTDGGVSPAPPAYVSPYSLQYVCDEASLTDGFDQPPRSEVSEESFDPTFAFWYSVGAYPQGQLPWGPLQRLYPAPTVPGNCDPVVWQRERVLASAVKRVGTHYQHHHIPDWDPAPYNWPAWNRVSLGHNGPGIDCSDFTAWNYNFALGLKLSTAVQDQADAVTVKDGADHDVAVQVVLTAPDSSPVAYQTLLSTLKTGDLLYIRGQSSKPVGEDITHVIMWVGGVGRSPDGAPLIIDSHDNTPPVYDSNGALIPAGVQLRPFLEGSWYHRAFDHAHRLVKDT